MSDTGLDCSTTPAMDAEWSPAASLAETEVRFAEAARTEPRENRRASSASRVRALPCPLWKRTIDLVGASLGLVVLLPVFIAVALLIKCNSRGPVFFRQRRFGAGGRPFILWKFRTMEINEASTRHRSHVSDLLEGNLPLTKRDYELAIIPGGQILRKYGLDELPQLFNVLRGEMSLVGPRPDVVPLRNYKQWQRRRFQVAPGITGLWQVCGKNDTTFDTMIQLDILYIRRRSIWFDMFILLRTLPAVVRN